MNRNLSHVLLSLFAGIILSQAATAQQPPVKPDRSSSIKPAIKTAFVHANVKNAWEASQKSRRPIFLFVSMNRCHYCDKMLSSTYAQPEVVRFLQSNFESVTMKREAYPGLIKQLGVRVYPTTLIISPEGQLLGKIEGYADLKKFAPVVNTSLARMQKLAKR